MVAHNDHIAMEIPLSTPLPSGGISTKMPVDCCSLLSDIDATMQR